MSGVRTTLTLAAAVAVCGALLWTLERWRPAPPAGDTLATTRLFPRGFGDVESLIVEREAFRAEIGRRGGRWFQTAPFVAELDQPAVRRLLDTIADAPLLDRIALGEMRRRQLSLADFGLTPAAVRVVVRTRERRIEICLGRSTPGGGEVYGYLDAADRVFVTSRAVQDAVPTALAGIRERALLREGLLPVAAVELRRPGTSYLKVVRGGGGWQLTQPVAAPADQDAVMRVVDALRQARIEAFVWPAGTNNAAAAPGDLRTRLALYGLDADNAVQVQLWESGSPVGTRLRFGRPAEEYPGCLYALTADEQGVVAVSNAILPVVQATPADLRDKRLFVGQPPDIDRLQLRFSDLLVECRRDTQRRWTLVSPLEDAADQEQVSRLLMGLWRLKADRVLDIAGAAVGPAASPVCVVELSETSRVSRLTVARYAQPGWMELTLDDIAARYLVATGGLPAAIMSPTAAYGLRDRLILAAASNTVRRLTAKRGERSETVERTPDGTAWQVAGVPPGLAPAPNVPEAWVTLFGGLTAMRIERLGTGARDLARFGLGAPWLEIAIETPAAAESLRKVLLVGAATPDGGRFAMLRGHDAVFVLGPESLRVLGLSLVQIAAPAAP